MLKYAIDIFGLEQDLVDAISSEEKSKFEKAVIYLFITTGLTFFSTFWGGKLISGSWLSGFFIGLIFTFVIFSVIRFSLITIKLPLAGEFYEEVLNKQKSKQGLNTNSSALDELISKNESQESNQSSSDIQKSDETTAPKQSRISRILNFIKSKIKILNINIGVLVRVFIFCVLMQVPIFFSVVLLNKRTTNNIISVKRDQVFHYYQNVLEESKKSALLSLYKNRKELVSVTQKLKSLNQQGNITYKNKIDELNKVNKEILEVEAYWNSTIPRKLSDFKISIKDDFYIAPLISAYFNRADYWLVEFIYLFIFFLPVRIFKSLRNNSQKYNYNLISIDQHRKRILDNYHVLEDLKKKHLSNYGIKPNNMETPFLDAPFNTVKNQGKIRNQEIDIAEYYAN
ncbi:MAG: hypothetical protein ACON5K_09350 [Bacteroidia bacterium]